ncbi:MAG: hypothetical protein KDC54_08545, partial [Lewinella sp.]|nr:hypothetical protein [Lewinella sp.]
MQLTSRQATARRHFDRWVSQQQLPCILGGHWADWSATWLDLRRRQGPFADPDCVTDIDRFDAAIQQLLAEAGATVGLGGYGEERPFYISPLFAERGPDGQDRWRSLHLGL